MVPNNYLLPNPLSLSAMPVIKNTLQLNQVEGFAPVREFVDETNTRWTLVKEASNSTVDVPDPKSMQILDYWNHEFPGIKSKLYIYVVEGVKQPRVETEQPTKVLYQWFSPVFVPTFTPAMITDKEWLKANVYAAPVVNGRVSKLNALCHVSTMTNTPEQSPPDTNQLLQIEELNNGTAEGDTKQAQGRNARARTVVHATQTDRDANVPDQHHEP